MTIHQKVSKIRSIIVINVIYLVMTYMEHVQIHRLHNLEQMLARNTNTMIITATAMKKFHPSIFFNSTMRTLQKLGNSENGYFNVGFPLIR